MMRHFFREISETKLQHFLNWFKFKIFTLVLDIGSKSFGALALILSSLSSCKKDDESCFARGVKLSQS